MDDLIAAEVDKTKKYFSVLLMEARSAKPESPTDIPVEDDDEELELEAEDSEEERELTEADERAIAKGRKVLRDASTALTNYQGFAAKPSIEELVQNNIFTKEASKKPTLPPRGPHGQFVARDSVHDEQEEAHPAPYLIMMEDYLLNDMEFEQKQLRYFVRDKTLIDPEDNDEAVDNAVVGEDNLTQFPQAPKDEMSIICVRNEGLRTDYEIRLVHESLTEYMGLGEEDEDADDDEFVYQD